MATELYLQIGGKERGPISAAQLKELAASGKITPETLVKNGLDGKWVPAGNIPGLFGQKDPAISGRLQQPEEPSDPVTLNVPAVVPAVPSSSPFQTPPPSPTQLPPQQWQSPPQWQPAQQTNVQVNVAQSTASHSLGISSIILGVLGLLTTCIPFVAVPLLTLGLLLGIAGIVVAILRRGTGVGYSITGTVICGLFFLPMLAIWLVASATADAARRALDESHRTNQTVVARPEASPNAPKLPAEPPVQQPPKNNEPEKHWANASEAVAQGDVQVSVVSARIGKIALKDLTGENQSKDDLLQINLQIQNTSSVKKLEYRGWSGQQFSLGKGVAHLEDNFGNAYKRIDFGFGTDVVGQVKSDSIYPGKSILDTLVFELPVDTAECVRLELPGVAFGGEGFLRIEIPVGMIQRQ